MLKFQTSEQMRECSLQWQDNGETIAFVPTMGALHDGHLSLVKKAKQKASRVVVSIFVNPTQFGDAGDLERYPRRVEQDSELLHTLGVDAVFVPSNDEIYQSHFASTISVSGITDRYEGSGRPGHFNGVATVVYLLFKIVQPHLAVFGEKDFQQLRMIEQMCSDLMLDVEIVRGALIRDKDGLALSSRNQLLTPQDREVALSLSQSLFSTVERFKGGERDLQKIIADVKDDFGNRPDISLHYFDIVRELDMKSAIDIKNAAELPDTLKEDRLKENNQNLRALIAATVSEVRLIDNISLG